MAIKRNTVVKKQENLQILEEAELILSEEFGYLGENISYDIKTKPIDYDKSNLLVISSDDKLLTVDNESRTIRINSSTKSVASVYLKDVTTSEDVDSKEIETLGMKTGSKPKVAKKDDSKEESKEVKKDDSKEESKEKEVKKVSKNTKTKKEEGSKMTEKIKVNRVKKAISDKKVSRPEASVKSLTKDNLLDKMVDTFVDSEGNHAYTKKEINDIISLADSLRTQALKEGKVVYAGDIIYKRRLQKGRVYEAGKLEKATQDSYVTPHVSMVAKVDGDDREVLKGEYKDGKFTDTEGKVHDVVEANEKFEAEYKKKFK